tara:strand:+ start:122566 stop:123165 length:600 start_codon:yes stop_codon:yes gene_type:complete
MLEEVKKYCEDRIAEFDQIHSDRKRDLEKIGGYIKQSDQPNIIFVCTHNSRRSQLSQVWATVAAQYYKLVSAHFHSSGTESTAFHPNAINALKRVGFKIEIEEKAENPVYSINFGSEKTIKSFSKTIDHNSLPESNFAAIMTCGHAEENCPFLPGAELRIPITYEDPKISDGTSKVEKVYDERCKQIAREMLYLIEKTF